MSGGSRSERALVRLFRLLLRLHPRELRHRYGREMEAVFRAVLCGRREGGGRAGLARVAAHELWTLAVTGMAERVRGPGTGGAGMRIVDDVRHAARGLRVRPWQALGAVLVIALGLAAHTTVVAVAQGVILGPEREGGGGTLAEVWTHGDDPDRGGPGIRPDLLFTLREDASLFRVLEGFSQGRGVVGGEQEPEWVWVMRGTPGFLEVFGIRPALGSDLRAGATGERVALLSHDLWLRRYGGERGALGRTIDVEGEDHVIAGVLPPGFQFPDRGPAVWIPVHGPDAEHAPASFFTVGWLRDGTTAEAADSALEIRTADLREAGLLGAESHPWVLDSVLIGTPEPVRRALWLFLGAATFILLVAGGNALGLTVARALARRPEAAVRSALGCGRGRLSGHLVMEGAVLGLTGGALAYAAFAAALPFLVRTLPDQARIIPFGRALSPTPFDLAWALLGGLALGLLMGAAGALVALPRASTGTGRSRTSTGDRLTSGLRRGLVVAQVAFSFILLAGSAILGRSFLELTRVERGYASGELLLAEIRIPPSRDLSPPDREELFRRVRQRLGALPGVRAVAETSSPLPLSSARFRPELESDAGRRVEMEEFLPWDPVAPGYFRAAGIELIAGRGLEPGDVEGSVVVGESLARALWADEPAVGRRFRLGDDPWLTVVGVAEDVPHMGLRGTGHRMAYYSRLEDHRRPAQSRVLLLRTEGAPSALAPAVRAELRALDPGLPLQRLMPLEEALQGTIGRERSYAVLMAAFAAVAALLSGLGLYAVLAQHVGSRTREIGIRMSLGADRTRLFGSVLRQGGVLTVLGIILGLGGALLLSRVLEGLVFEVSPADPLALAGTALFFLTTAVVACSVPGRRAVRVDPVRALAVD